MKLKFNEIKKFCSEFVNYYNKHNQKGVLFSFFQVTSSIILLTTVFLFRCEYIDIKLLINTHFWIVVFLSQLTLFYCNVIKPLTNLITCYPLLKKKDSENYLIILAFIYFNLMIFFFSLTVFLSIIYIFDLYFNACIMNTFLMEERIKILEDFKDKIM